MSNERKVAIVTGASRGIGATVARRLAADGFAVIVNYAGSAAAAAEVVAEIAAAGGQATAVQADVADPAAARTLFDEAVRAYGRVDVLVNNAGGQFPTTAEQLSPRGWEAVVRNNLNGTFYLTREVATRALLPQRSGSIVNVIANIARGFPCMVHTGAARAGVENMTMTLAVEWAQFDVRVNAVAPGIIESTGIAQYPPELVEMSIGRTPQQRIGTVEEVAHAVVYLASPAAAFITGATLRIDGGASLWGDPWLIPKRAGQ
jgi:citronellol/citronellal dehydrogenase